MIKIRKAFERGQSRLPWLNSKHTFSFSQYFDPEHMGFGALRVINDDIVAPSRGFSAHPHENMEIITVVLSGTLEHKDTTGKEEILTSNDIQKMSAGTGIIHSEYNNSDTEPVHFLQIWIIPDKLNIKPQYEQKEFLREDKLNKLCLIASNEGIEGSFKIHQNINIYQTYLQKDKTIVYSVLEYRKVWIQAALGKVCIDGLELEEGDGLAIEDEQIELKIKGEAPESNIIIFDMDAKL